MFESSLSCVGMVMATGEAGISFFRDTPDRDTFSCDMKNPRFSLLYGDHGHSREHRIYRTQQMQFVNASHGLVQYTAYFPGCAFDVKIATKTKLVQ